jgi:hypothetical protein
MLADAAAADSPGDCSSRLPQPPKTSASTTAADAAALDHPGHRRRAGFTSVPPHGEYMTRSSLLREGTGVTAELNETASHGVRHRVSADEWEARVNLAACYRLAAHYRMTDLIYTHISARVPGPDHTSSSTRSVSLGTS